MKTIQMQKERAAFFDYWCEDVPDYMRDKWRESVNELLDTPNAHDKLQAAWDAWQARASILNQNATCEPTADKQDAARYRAYRQLMDKPVDDWPEGVALARTPEALDAALDAGLKSKG